MATNYSPLTINRHLDARLRSIQTAAIQGDAARQELGGLLQHALQLEFATIPTYLSAVFSLTPANTKISELILRAAIEEMLHMTAVANLMNAIGVAPDIVAAVPDYPCQLTILDPPLKLDLRSFSYDLVKDLFMQIETPEEPVHYPMALAAGRPRTIGQFYEGIIEIIDRDTIPGLFGNATRDAYKQREVVPNFRPIAYISNQDTDTYPLKNDINFRITDKASAVRHLRWVVGQGEGTAPFNPLTAEGIPAHFYRFESIIKQRFLVKDERVKTLGYSFSGGDLPFDETGVHEFVTNTKAADFAGNQAVSRQMKRFNDSYTSMVNSLQQAFNCPAPEQKSQADVAFADAMGTMQTLPNRATAIIQTAQQQNVKAGIPFEFPKPPIA
ncbi:ferritin-like protein [Bradyrhizobium sp. CB82]|uniref:ferritin-like domain-containing protein n=1 Tax=Bradyrhizobium sp. CB82 TaxID=3039159 RepID=UPI0024B0CFDE|nr:ferritin-like protein [Bradyrhizobium sp. CB82]WFU44160.1 ferritin-like protein [Bradyrhizobium sp. CB82]